MARDRTRRACSLFLLLALIGTTTACRKNGKAGVVGSSEAIKAPQDLVSTLCATFRWKRPPSLDRALKFPPTPVIGDAVAQQLSAGPAGFRANFSGQAARHRVSSVLPASADGALSLTDEDTGLSAQVTLVGATHVAATVLGGYLAFPAGHQSGADIIHRPTGSGIEDFVYFKQKPENEELRYRISINDKVAGIRNVAGVVELLDSTGAPRLHLSSPVLADTDGNAYPTTVSVEGCAVDLNPIVPWGRSVTAPGSTLCTVHVAWDRSHVPYPALLDPVWASSSAAMTTERDAHTATLVTSGANAGKILIAGGNTSSGPTSSAELFDPTTGTFAVTGSMVHARAYHCAALLGTTVAVSGGRDGTSTLSSVEGYNANAGTWGASGPTLATARSGHTMTALPNGKVLIAGGEDSAGLALASAELFNPSASTFSPLAMTQVRDNFAAVLLPNNQVLLIGGNNNTGLTNTAEIFDGNGSGTFTPVASMSTARQFHAAGLLANGKVLVVGSGVPELYDPAGSWEQTSAPRLDLYRPTMSIVGGGALMTGGYSDSGAYQATAEFYDIQSNTWLYTANFQPTTSTWTEADMTSPRLLHASTAFGTSSVLVTGGLTASGNALSSADVYTQQAINDPCNYGVVCSSGACSSTAGTNGYCNPAGITFAIAPETPSFTFESHMFMAGADFIGTLTNTSNGPVSVSAFGIGNISVVSLNLGTTLLSPGPPTLINFHEYPGDLQQQHLVTLDPGQSAGLGISGVQTVNSQWGAPVRVSEYTPVGPGTYRVVFRYSYIGPDKQFPNVFHGSVTAPELSFVVN